MARKGRNPYVICRMPSGWLVIGDVQPLPGYCVLLADPVVESPNALDEVQRGRYSLDFSHYEPVPPNVQKQLMEAYKPKHEED